jgi:hypothetical protein
MELLRHNSQQSLPARVSSSIATRRHAKQERSARKSTRNQGGQVGRGALEEARAVEISKYQIQLDRSCSLY